MLRWAVEHDCPWDKWATAHAAEGGHLVLWAREHGCPWEKREGERHSQNQPEVLRWVRQQP